MPAFQAGDAGSIPATRTKIMPKNLILISGVGNYDRLFDFFAIIWRIFGYKVKVNSFGWNDRAENFDKKMLNLLSDIDGMHGQQLYIIGVSAGGSAAIHALAQRPNITKVVTLCSPLMTMPSLRNPLLERSIAKLPESFSALNEQSYKKILSLYAKHDDIVDPLLSQPQNVQAMQLSTSKHGFTIFMTLTFLSRPIRKFFRS